jgi:septum site-determining protein MinD
MGQIFGILSLKGGVGKTSSTVSLGSCLADAGKKVLLVDCNFSAPNLGMHLNIVEPKKTIHHVLKKEANLEDSIHEMGNFHVIPASIFKEPIINPLKLRDYLKSIRRKYDFIILDSSPALNDETLSVILAADKLLVVTTPDYPTLSTTLKAIKLAKTRGTPIVGLILNKVYNKKFELKLDEIERTVDVPIMAVIPYDIHFSKSLSSFKPYPSHKPNSKGSIEYQKLAKLLSGEKYEPKKLQKLLKKLTPKRQDINREIYYQSFFG